MLGRVLKMSIPNPEDETMPFDMDIPKYHTCRCCFSYESKKDEKDQESIQPSTTPDPGYHTGKRQDHD